MSIKLNDSRQAPLWAYVDIKLEDFADGAVQDAIELPGDAIVVGGIGAGAITKLNAMGIKVYRAARGTVSDNVGLFETGELPEMNASHACGGHGHAGGCGH